MRERLMVQGKKVVQVTQENVAAKCIIQTEAYMT